MHVHERIQFAIPQTLLLIRAPPTFQKKNAPGQHLLLKMVA